MLPTKFSPIIRYAVVLIALLAYITGPLAAKPNPSPAALKLAEGLKSSLMGVDRLSNLWSWKKNFGSFQVLSPGGSLLVSTRTEPHASGLDFDPQWGLVWVSPNGKTLQVIHPNKKAEDVQEPEVFILKEKSGDVAWLGPRLVAISPVRAAHRVEIWDLDKGERLETWGRENAIQPRIGTVRLNRFKLHYDFEHQLLYTLETFSGRLEIFDSKGSVVLQYQVPPRDDGHSLAGWLEKSNQKNIEKGEIQEVTLDRWPHFAVSPEGTVWIHQKCLEEQSNTTQQIQRILLNGKIESIKSRLPPKECCSHYFTFWGDWVYLYWPPDASGDACVQRVQAKQFKEFIK